MSRTLALAQHIKNTLEEMKKNPQPDVVELLAKLCEHADDAVALEQEQMAREDKSKGVGV